MRNQEINLFIGHVHFKMNHGQSELYQADLPYNTIRLDELKDEGEYYTTLFDKDTSNLHSGMVDPEKLPGHVIPVHLPKAIVTGNTDIIPAVNRQSREDDWNIFVADAPTMRRLQGCLPKIKIEGELYTIDWRLRELRHWENPLLRIGINSLEVIEDGTAYRALYDKDAKRMVEQPIGKENPDSFVFVHIPYELKLDPVAVAREYGLKETELLAENPYQEELKATSVELDAGERQQLKTYLEKCLRDNMAAKQQGKGKGKGI